MGDVSTLPARVEPGAELFVLAGRRLAVLVDEPDTTLDAVMRRLFNPDEQQDVPISAFASAL